ncbi:hypothetical protein ACHWQZ_G005461 [Mnemiopsis leidyi]
MRGLVLFAAALQVALVWGCSDTSTDCAYYKEAGYCESYADTLKEMCAKSCGFCGGGGQDGGDPGTEVDPRPAREPEKMDLCRDTCSTKDCQWFKSQGHCEKYSAVMTMNCASTCNWCGARVCNPPDVENGWTDFEMIMVPAGATANVYCYEGFKNMGSARLTCNAYGEIDGSARCEEVAKDDGSGYPAQQETDCQRAVKAAMEPTYANGQYVVPQISTHYVPQCDDYSGNYKEIQYDGGKGSTFCVDMYRGIEVQGTRIQGKHEYISCAPGSAKEYYDRLALEKAAAGSPSYDYGNSGSSYVYNYDNSGSSYDYNYDNSGSSYDYNYADNTNSGSGSVDYYASNNDGYASSGNDYYASGNDGYASGGDAYYASGNDGYASGGDAYYASGNDGYASGGDDYYASGNDGYASGGDAYYASGNDGYASGGDEYYASGNDGYASGNDGSASGGYDYYASGNDGYASGGDDSYASGNDGYASGGYDYYASGNDGYASGGDDYSGGSEGSAIGGDDYYATGGDDYYATGGDDYYATGGDDYYATGGDDYYATGGDDYYATGGDDYYATGGDGFDGSYYYADGAAEAEDEVESNYRVALADSVEGVIADEKKEMVMEKGEEDEFVSNKDAMRRRNRKRRRNKREAEDEPAEKSDRRIKPKVVKKYRERLRPQRQLGQTQSQSEIENRGLTSKVGWLLSRKQTLGKIVEEGLCMDKIRPDKCRTYRRMSWCQAQTRYMKYFCPETCEMCSELNLLTYEESQNLKLRREDERQRQEERKNEEERKRAEEKRKEEELLAMLAEEQLMCDVDLEETACASDIEVKDIVQKAADQEAEDQVYVEGGVMSPMVQALWDNYDPSKDSQCSDHQYKQTCDGHKSRGQCQNKPFYMLQNCKKTCEMCTPLMCQVPSDIEHGYTDPGMPVPPGFKIFISCEDSYYLLGRGTITCQKDGFYSPGGECIKMTDQLLLRMTKCQREKYRKSQPVQLPEVGWIIPEYELVPECDTRGQYLPMQCNRCCCFCVNLNGNEIKDTRFTHASGERPDCSPYEFNKRPADKYFPSERSKGKLYGRDNMMDNVFENYSKTKANKRTKRGDSSFLEEFLEIDSLSCNDISPLCKDFATAGQCLSEAPYMMQFCPRSCGTCPIINTPKRPACSDKRENCASYVAAGYCSFFKNFMMDNCAETCGFCGNRTMCSPISVENGQVYPEGPVVPGSIVQVSCDEGYKLSGRSLLRCVESGDYNHPSPSCRAVTSSNSTCLDMRYKTSRPVFNTRFNSFIVPLESFVPSCTEWGEFHEMQCYNGECWCVDVETGEEVSETRGDRLTPRLCNPRPRIFRRLGRSAPEPVIISEDCVDYDPDRCEENVSTDREYCIKYPAEAFYNCRRSCRLCGDSGSNSIELLSKWCPTFQIEEGYTEPYYPVLSGNTINVYCSGHSTPKRTVCQPDGTYHPPVLCSSQEH